MSLVSDFQHIEENYRLLLDKVDDFCYWLYIRTKIYEKIYLQNDFSKNSKGLSKIPKQRSSSFSGDIAKFIDKKTSSRVMELISGGMGIKDCLNVLKNLTINHPYLYHRKHDLLILSSPRRVLKEGKYFAYWTDEIATYYGDKSVSAESLNVIKHLRPSWTENLIEIEAADIIPLIMGEILSRFNSAKLMKIKAEKIKEIFIKELNIDLGHEYLNNLLETRYFWYKLKTKFFSKLIENISPKLIVEINSYSTNNMVVNEIAHKRKIPVVELQHGIIGRNHIAYNYLVQRKYDSLPDILLTFSDYWKETCSFPIAKDNIIAAGYPYFEEQIKAYKKMDVADHSFSIVVLSQPIFQKQMIDFTEKCILELKKMSIQFRILYKLHPTECLQNEDIWKRLMIFEEVELINNPDRSIYELFSVSRCQIGATSTAVYEGLAYNLKTFIIQIKDSKERMADLIDNGFAVLCKDEKDFINTLLSEKSNINKKSSEYFFKPNALANICSILDAFMYNGKNTQ